MRILLTGANGFIGSALVRALLRDGHQVRAVVRHTEAFVLRFPACEAVALDLEQDRAHDPTTWQPLLSGVDAVVNAAGVLQPRRRKTAWAVHLHAADALFAACETAGVRRVVQISAIGVDEAETVYARSKRAGDRALMTRDLDWTVLRPAVVVGDGSYGGTSLLRALAACPFLTPLPGDGETPVDVIHKDDLAAGILGLLHGNGGMHEILEPAAPGRLSLRDLIARYRRWLGLGDHPMPVLPGWLAGAFARLGDLCRLDPITSTALQQFRARLTGNAQRFAETSGHRSRPLEQWLADRPAESQDLWHARLYLLRPAIRFALLALWLVSGLIGVTASPEAVAAQLAPLALSPAQAQMLTVTMGGVDLGVALALFFGWRLAMLARLQFILVLGYTMFLGLLLPAAWGELFGGLLKNLPILALIAVHLVLEEER